MQAIKELLQRQRMIAKKEDQLQNAVDTIKKPTGQQSFWVDQRDESNGL